MALSNKDIEELLEKIRKIDMSIDSSSVLNGGFEKLFISVEAIKEKQSEQSEKLDQINIGLYEPIEGLFSRVQQLENNLVSSNEKIVSHTQNDKNNFEKLENHLSKLEEVRKVADEAKIVTKRLQRIGGEDLEDVQKIVDINKKLSTLYWGLILVAASGIGNLIWQLVKHN